MRWGSGCVRAGGCLYGIALLCGFLGYFGPARVAGPDGAILPRVKPFWDAPGGWRHSSYAQVYSINAPGGKKATCCCQARGQVWLCWRELCAGLGCDVLQAFPCVVHLLPRNGPCATLLLQMRVEAPSTCVKERDKKPAVGGCGPWVPRGLAESM